ncbi:MAG TPA: hypothetical protein VK444_05335 [Methanobacteriaceae archaeon]|nr:hypothetical protein [Methanobacteriaceae archaeon]
MNEKSFSIKQDLKLKNSQKSLDWWKKQISSVKSMIGIVSLCFMGLIIIIGMDIITPPDKKNISNFRPAKNPTIAPTNTPSRSSSSHRGIQISVTSPCSWTGNYGDESKEQSVQGTESKTFSVSGRPNVVSAVFQKDDDGNDTLVVDLIKDGNVIERKSTCAQYGVVSFAHSFF